jgi:aspartyl-tRNA(Asn)/glutamyl-tRNA(Gln) amidotransferase subunit C
MILTPRASIVRTRHRQLRAPPRPSEFSAASNMSDSDLDTVYKVAALARLDVHEAEARALASQFARTLEHFKVLERLDVEGVEPMTGGSRHSDVQRDDVPVPSLDLERILANAPKRVDGFYSVPKTVGGDE